MTARPRPPTACATAFREAVVDRPATPTGTAPAMAFNLLIDQRPEAVARPRSAAETAAIVNARPRRSGLRIAPQGSGHNAGPLGLARRARC